jgi:hypothetical protein
VTQVLDYRPPYEDSFVVHVKQWLASPLSALWRGATIASAFAIIWGSAWLAGGFGVEVAGSAVLIAVTLYTTLRRSVRFFITGGISEREPPESERYARWQRVVIALAVATPLLNWPLRVSLLVQRPLLDSFGWHCFAEAPMLYPPTTPRMVGLYMVTKISPDPNGVTFTVRGGGSLRYDMDPDLAIRRKYACTGPPSLLLPSSGRWVAFPTRSLLWR